MVREVPAKINAPATVVWVASLFRVWYLRRALFLAESLHAS